jgi:hypothetical protein
MGVTAVYIVQMLYFHSYVDRGRTELDPRGGPIEVGYQTGESYK